LFIVTLFKNISEIPKFKKINEIIQFIHVTIEKHNINNLLLFKITTF
jgi:hypothetical protein